VNQGAEKQRGRQTSTSWAFSVCADVGDADGLSRDGGKGTGYPDNLPSAFPGSAVDLNVLFFLHGCVEVSVW